MPRTDSSRNGHNRLFFGDNLTVLREHVKDESVDLVYLDPPFNSNATYNVLFKEGPRIESSAQAEAFRDTWLWGEAAAIAYDEVVRTGGDVALLVRAFRSWLGDNAMMAYLAMMAVRLIELNRVLKPTGSLYLHCDPTASHYLKLLLDSIFGHEFFLSEVIWKRTSSHSSAKRWGPVHDNILLYSKGRDYTWNAIFEKYDPSYVAKFYRNSDERGQYQVDNLTGAGRRGGESGKPWRGADPDARGRHWAVPISLLTRLGFGDEIKEMSVQEKLDFLDSKGLIAWPKTSEGMPRLKRYLQNQQGVAIQDVVTDISAISAKAQERLGYPTQKPLALLERIISASSASEGVVLDPFCGCGTTIEAAQKLSRRWVGIDVTHYATTLIERRLAKTHPDTTFTVHGRPSDVAGARDLARRDKYQFQWWAAWLLGAQTYETKKGADRGIDGNIYFANGPYGTGRIVISVKGGDNVSPVMVRELSGVLQREDAQMGILVTLTEPTKSMLADAAGAGFVGKSGHGRLPRVQIATIADLLDRRFPKLPPLPQPLEAVPRSRGARDRDQLEFLLPIVGHGVMTDQGTFRDPRFMKVG